MMVDVKTNLEATSLSDNKQKIKKIEYTMNRDRKAFEILYKIIMTGMTKNDTNTSLTANILEDGRNPNRTYLTEVFDSLDLEEYLKGLEKRVEEHLHLMKESTDKMSELVMKFFEKTVKNEEVQKEEKEKPIQNKVAQASKPEPKPPFMVPNQFDPNNFFMNPGMYPFMYNPYQNWPFIAANVRI